MSENEGAKFWLSVLTEKKNRGVKDVFIACVEGLTGFPEAIPSDQSTMKVVYLAIEQTVKKWSMSIRNWKPAFNQFIILYEDRLTDIF